MICNSCGGPVQDNATVCPYCGQPLTPQAPPQQQFQQQPPPYQAPPPPFQQPPPYQPPIPTHMGEAIVVTLFCCLPLGIVAIVYASQVSSMQSSGNIIGAQQASKNAHNCAMIGAVLGLLSIGLAVLSTF